MFRYVEIWFTCLPNVKSRIQRTMFCCARDVPLSAEELQFLIEKILGMFLKLDLQEIPPLVYQLLLLSSKVWHESISWRKSTSQRVTLHVTQKMFNRLNRVVRNLFWMESSVTSKSKTSYKKRSRKKESELLLICVFYVIDYIIQLAYYWKFLLIEWSWYAGVCVLRSEDVEVQTIPQDQLRHVEGTVILHVVFAIRLDHELGRELFKSLKVSLIWTLAFS